MTTAIMSITAIGGSDGRRPLLMGAIAQQGVGYFYGHLDRWAALYDNQSLGKPVRLRDPKSDAVDESGEIIGEGRVDVIARRVWHGSPARSRRTGPAAMFGKGASEHRTL